MEAPRIDARGLSKCYRIRRRAPSGEDPEASPGRGGMEEHWALRDVSFSAAPGEVLGIIGPNGAGKSTLLRILSRITEPTEGEARLRGRSASLLEVGTGFHPELSGRENIFLNGAVLGMSRRETQSRFEEIVEFSGIGRFLETPVKRYSSGMYLRLAFAVAAHLRPDILLVDEVLAVGDAAFQRRCLEKMEDVGSREGRTVVFVSHNLAAVRQVCTRTLLLDQGRVAAAGPTPDALRAYGQLLRPERDLSRSALRNRLGRGSGAARFRSIVATGDHGESWNFRMGETIRLELSYEVYEEVPSLGLYLALRSALGGEVVTTIKECLQRRPVAAGFRASVTVEMPHAHLRPGDYSCYLCLGDEQCIRLHDVIDQNVDLPWLQIHSEEPDRHRIAGYFSIPYRLIPGPEGAARD